MGPAVNQDSDQTAWKCLANLYRGFYLMLDAYSNELSDILGLVAPGPFSHDSYFVSELFQGLTEEQWGL